MVFCLSAGGGEECKGRTGGYCGVFEGEGWGVKVQECTGEWTLCFVNLHHAILVKTGRFW